MTNVLRQVCGSRFPTKVLAPTVRIFTLSYSCSADLLLHYSDYLQDQTVGLDDDLGTDETEYKCITNVYVQPLSLYRGSDLP